MNAFLRAVEANLLKEREQHMALTHGNRLPGASHDFRRASGDNRGGDNRSLEGKAQRDAMLRRRAARVIELRGEGMQWTEIAREMGLTPKEVRHAVKRLGWT